MTKIKEKLKEFPFLRRTIKKAKISKEYKKDCRQFAKYYMDSSDGKEQLEYKIIFYSHSIEKGMTHDKIRPFGEQKIEIILDCLKKLQEHHCDTNSSSFKIGYNTLIEWNNVYDINKFSKTKINTEVENFINKNNCEKIKTGVMKYAALNNNELSIDYLEAIKNRHSTRKYKIKQITLNDLDYCVNAAIQSPSACNRQMCKVYYLKDNEKRKLLEKNIMGLTGFDMESVNLFLITFDISAFLFYGERNQGYFNSGLFVMNFVNAMHFKGIGSCILQWSNTNKKENEIKEKLGIPANEKIACAVAAGYYTDEEITIPVSPRKRIDEIKRII